MKHHLLYLLLGSVIVAFPCRSSSQGMWDETVETPSFEESTSFEEPTSIEETSSFEETPSYEESSSYGETSYYSEETTSTSESEPADQDATYVIKKGDTLWDLAFKFLGDPFQWPRIWELNRYIANPDLIYPGNRLVIPGRTTQSSVAGSGQVSNDFSSETQSALDETEALRDSLEMSEEYPGDSLLLSSLREKNVLSRKFFANVPYFWNTKDEKGNLYPGNAVVDPPETGASYQRFSEISITPFKSSTYQENDTVDIFSSLRIIRFNDKPVNLIRCVGRAAIKKVGEKKIYALLFEMFDPIIGKERVASHTPFKTLTIDTLIEPDVAITAKVFIRVEETASPYPFQKIILDKGNMQGVELGDVFGIYYREKDSPARLSVIGIIGHVGTSSSTLHIVLMSENRISKGDKAILLRRIRFSSEE